MSFISYAQKFEDVMLWRALKHIEDGFYIDVGAWSPDIDSVTRAFYERGWRGINVEPNPTFHAQLAERRTRDINLRMAVSDKAGSLMMNFLSILVYQLLMNPSLKGMSVQVGQLITGCRSHYPCGFMGAACARGPRSSFPQSRCGGV